MISLSPNAPGNPLSTEGANLIVTKGIISVPRLTPPPVDVSPIVTAVPLFTVNPPAG